MTMLLHHVAFRTSNVAALAAFYREVFDLQLVRDALPRSVWLGLGPGAALMLELRSEDEPAIAAGSMELVAFSGDDAARSLVRQRAVERGCFDGETSFTVYVRDPDGRRVGVSTYRFENGG